MDIRNRKLQQLIDAHPGTQQHHRNSGNLLYPDAASRKDWEVIQMSTPKMTLYELAEAMRANGIPATEDKLQDMAIAGKLPFSFGIEGEDNRGGLRF